MWPDKQDYPNDIQKEYRLYSTDIGYESINTALRKVDGDPSQLPNVDLSRNWDNSLYDDYDVQRASITAQGLAERIELMDDVMNNGPKVPENIVVSRGTDWREFKNLGINSKSDDLSGLVGKKYTNVAYSSTSLAGVAAMSYKDVQITITVPKGSKAVNMAGDRNHYGALSALASENELLLARSSSFKITKVTQVGSQWKVEVELVSQ